MITEVEVAGNPHLGFTVRLQRVPLNTLSLMGGSHSSAPQEAAHRLLIVRQRLAAREQVEAP
ncbi:hypothetical protein EYF80_048206 [Liparis tanakae]|uniref:Uncharacterized protein n=1 Tax=Liparis tanakae TaxID=230148 RepID=A0A4Z2FMT7_9TELE|nr:hypothetical protein EYF80_048206 [Liparis tanakae]